MNTLIDDPVERPLDQGPAWRPPYQRKRHVQGGDSEEERGVMSGTTSDRLDRLREKIHEQTCDFHIELNHIEQTIAELERLERETPDEALSEAIGRLRKKHSMARQILKTDHAKMVRALNDAGAKL